MTLALALYDWLARGPGPRLAERMLARRLKRGKEDPDRLSERMGTPGRDRPSGALLWLHAASVGEAVSLLPVIRLLDRDRPDLTLLMTTGTRTSAALMAERLPSRAIHQYAPLDVRPALERFVAHWRPAALCVVESEIWPTMLAVAAEHRIPALLASARLSAKSARSWGLAPRTARALMGRFTAILAQSDAIADRFKRLGAPADRVSVAGSLKSAADPLPDAPGERADIAERIGARPRWLAASTHPGEEAAALDAHAALRRHLPTALTLIAPRHPERGAEVAALARARGLTAALRSETPAPAPDCEVFVIDRLGELGLWYRMAPLAFIGGAMTVSGGHNPMEAARLVTAILTGPHWEAFQDDYAALTEADAVRVAADPEVLSRAVAALLASDGGALRGMASRAAAVAEALDAEGRAVARRVADRLSAFVPPQDAEVDDDAA